MVRLEPAIDQPSAEDHLRFLFCQRFVLCVQRAVLLVVHRIVGLVAGMPFADIFTALLQRYFSNSGFLLLIMDSAASTAAAEFPDSSMLCSF